MNPFKNKTNYLITQLSIFSEHREGLDKFFEEEQKLIIEAGRNDALNNPPTTEIDIEKLPEVVRTKNSHLTELSSINKTIKGVLDTSYSDYENSNRKISELESGGSINDFRTDKQEAKDDLKSDYDSENNSLNEQVSEEQKDLKNHSLDLKGRIKYPTFWRCLLAVFFLGLTGFTEVFYTASAFEITGLAYMERHLISVGLSISCLFVGIGTIELIKSKKLSTIWKAVSSVGLCLLISAVFYVLGELRVSLVEMEIASSGASFSSISPVGFMLISLIFYIAIILIHWIIWPPKKHFKENRKYKNVQGKINKSEKKIAKLSKEIKAIPVKRRKEVSLSNKSFDKAKKDFDTNLNGLKKKRDKSIAIHDNTYGRVVAFVEQVDSHYKSMVGLYISTMNRYRKDEALLVIPEIISLPDPFKDFSYIVDYSQENSAVENEEENTITDIPLDI